jgi:hypothetical protein
VIDELLNQMLRSRCSRGYGYDIDPTKHFRTDFGAVIQKISGNSRLLANFD